MEDKSLREREKWRLKMQKDERGHGLEKTVGAKKENTGWVNELIKRGINEFESKKTWYVVPSVWLIFSSLSLSCVHRFSSSFSTHLLTHTQPWPVNIWAIKDPTLKSVGHRRACGLKHSTGGNLDGQEHFNRWGLPHPPLSNFEQRDSFEDEDWWRHHFQWCYGSDEWGLWLNRGLQDILSEEGAIEIPFWLSHGQVLLWVELPRQTCGVNFCLVLFGLPSNRCMCQSTSWGTLGSGFHWYAWVSFKEFLQHHFSSAIHEVGALIRKLILMWKICHLYQWLCVVCCIMYSTVIDN